MINMLGTTNKFKIYIKQVEDKKKDQQFFKEAKVRTHIAIKLKHIRNGDMHGYKLPSSIWKCPIFEDKTLSIKREWSNNH